MKSPIKPHKNHIANYILKKKHIKPYKYHHFCCPLHPIDCWPRPHHRGRTSLMESCFWSIRRAEESHRVSEMACCYWPLEKGMIFWTKIPLFYGKNTKKNIDSIYYGCRILVKILLLIIDIIIQKNRNSMEQYWKVLTLGSWLGKLQHKNTGAGNRIRH